eukprot:3559030-Pyramimonas_sp.AAC.1
MASDGITHATTAPAIHGLTMLPSGEIVLGRRAGDILVMDETKLMGHWRFFLNPDASRDAVVAEETGTQ